MPLEIPARCTSGSDRVLRAAMALWLSALAVVCIRSLLFPKAHTVYPTFVAAGKDWCDGVPL
jgi:hypothetical protein